MRFLILLRNEKELEEDGQSNPRFLDLIKNKKGSKNETIDGELEEGGRSDHRFWILKRNQKELQNQTSLELEKGGRSNPRLLDLIKNKKRSKNETINGELEEDGRSYHRFWSPQKKSEGTSKPN